jgi:maltooligosyltrehalose trehalohydrolase
MRIDAAEGGLIITKVSLGATYLGEGRCRFLVWAPLAEKLDVHLISPTERLIPLARDDRGYFHGVVEGVEPGALYLYRLDGHEERPDPASRRQPQGVHKPSQVVDPRFPWQDRHWSGLSLHNFIVYELHPGTFTPEGTFAAIIPYLDELKELGVTALELMPVAQFPGHRNWGYDGVHPFAVQNTYGGPQSLKELVNACHLKGLAVILDVVYNHLGPEGNYLWEFGHYFTERYRTPWGAAVNFDGPYSDEVRRFFIENALYWITEFHFDALRLDALHAILDHSAQTFLKDLAEAVHEAAEKLNRRVYLIVESDLNDVRLINPPELGGFGLDGHWLDDFHHALHCLITGEDAGYYMDFGAVQHLAKSFREGFIYSGEYSRFRRRRHGSSSRHVAAHRFAAFAQNHDQVGNRRLGERLSRLTSLEGLKLAAGVVALSPFIPLFFMGEEYGETAPFQYFISFLDEDLVQAVRDGRKEEFAAFQAGGEPPDPQAEATFRRSRLNHALKAEEPHRTLWVYHREILRLRREVPALAHLSKKHQGVRGFEQEKVLWVRRWVDGGEVLELFHFGTAPQELTLPFPPGEWEKILDSAEEKWLGSGSLLPPALTSRGEATLTLAPQAVALFGRRRKLG